MKQTDDIPTSSKKGNQLMFVLKQTIFHFTLNFQAKLMNNIQKAIFMADASSIALPRDKLIVPNCKLKPLIF